MKKKIGLKAIKQIDRSGMLDVLLDFPAQLKAAYDIGQNAKISFEKKDFQKVVFAGLGGSAIAGDLVKSYLYFTSRVPISIYREYDLPAMVDESTLVFLSSYSGNTEETLSAYRQAKEKGAALVAISSDGTLKEFAREDKAAFIQIPPFLAPRCALGYLSIVPLCLLAKLGIGAQVEAPINQAVRVLEDLRNERLSPRIGIKENIAKFIASNLVNKFPVIYSASVHFDAAAIRFRSQLNENSKALAASHFFPEMNHNEIVGWQNPKKLFRDFTVVMLRDRQMHPQVSKRMEITKEILKKEGIKVMEIWSQGEDLLSRIFSLIYIGDFISFYLAILYAADPTPVERVTYLKERLS